MLIFSRKNKYILCLIFIALISHLRWFDFSSILNFADWTFRYDEVTNQLYNSYGAWLNFFNFGVVNIQLPFNFFTSIWSLFTNLGFSYDFATKVTFLIPIATLGFIAPYILFKKLTKNELISFIVALFYGGTTYFLIRQTAHMPVAFVYALAPLIFYFLIRALERNKLINWLIFILTYWISGCYEIRITYIVTFLLFFYFLFFRISNIKKYRKNILISISLLVGLNIFWLLPTILGGFFENISVIAGRGLFGSFLFDLRSAFALSVYSWTGVLPNSQFIKQSIIWYFWLIPLIAFSVFLFKNFKYKKKIIFFGIISLIGIFLTKQAAVPLTGAYLWLYNNFPGFNLFREASKFYLVTAIGYAGLIGYGLLVLKEHKNKIWNKYLFSTFSIILIIISLWNVKPLITGEIRTMFISKNIPADYLVLKDFILKQPDYFRTFWTPRDSRWGIYTNQKPKISNVDVIDSEWKDLLETYNENEKLIQNRITNAFKLSFADSLADISSIKYVIAPLQDIENDDDFFIYYGGDKDPNIHQWYIDQIDHVSWLKKIDIGTNKLVVYENENYKQPVFSFTNLYSLDSFTNLDNKYDFVTNQLKKDFYFTIGSSTSPNLPLSQMDALFEDIKPENIDNSVIKVSVNQLSGDNNDLYTNADNGNIYIAYQNNQIIFYKQSKGSLFLNDIRINSVTGKKIIKSIKVVPGNKYYGQIDNQSFALKSGGELDLGVSDEDRTIDLSSTAKNIIPNPSFENGVWQEKVGDCNNSDDNSIMTMGLDSVNKTDGKQALQLEATTHIACTSIKIPITEVGEYILTFDYQSPNSDRAGYYLGFNDNKKTVVKSSLPINDDKWQIYTKKIIIPDGATTGSLFLYAYSKDNKTNIINRYDNFKLAKLIKLESIEIKNKNEFNKIPIALQSEKNVFEYKDDSYDYKNIISNPSFELGPWNEKVGDCHNYDDEPKLGMMLNNNEKLEGNNSLQLEAERHIACTSTNIPVKENGVYLLSFDYQSSNSKQAGYYIGFNDEEKTNINEKLEIENKEWNSFEKKIKIPSGADSLSLYIYAYESDKKKNNIVRYDNFKLIEVPDLVDKYYLVSEPEVQFVEPDSITFNLINPTKKLVHIKGATTPFFLAMSESYHAQWQAQMNNQKIQGLFNKWWPFAKPDKVGNEYHYELNGFLNSWYVDTENLCESNSACTKNPDGSYDIEMVIEFWPQRWFYLGLIISGTTLFSCIGYLIYDWRRRRRKIIHPVK